jgi:hypothetical protein
MTGLEIGMGTLVLLVGARARLRFHERLPRRGELDRHSRFDRRA